MFSFNHIPTVKEKFPPAVNSDENERLTEHQRKFDFIVTRSLHKSLYDYAYPTVKEDQYSEKNLILSSGKVLGGSSCINFAIWTRGAQSEYDLWASEAGSDELSWAKMKPSFDRVTSVDGPIHTRRVSNTPRNHYWSRVARSGFEESGYQPLPDFDLNQGLLPFANSNYEDQPTRVFGEITECLDPDATRNTAGRYFDHIVDPLLRNGSQHAAFEVWTDIRVEKIVFDNDQSDIRAVGVKTPFGIIRAANEVILTAGALQSPYILLSSGIGPSEHLASRGIPVLRDLPGVGRNLWEHPFIDVRAKIRPSHRNETVETFASLKTSASHMHEWATEGKGLMSGLLYEWLAYSNMKPEVEEAMGETGVSPTLVDRQVLLRSNIPHVEHFIHYGHGLTPAPDPLESSYIAITCALLVPRSRGFVEIPFPPDHSSVDGDYPKSPSIPQAQALASPSVTNSSSGPVPRHASWTYPENPRIVVNQLKDIVDQRVMFRAVRKAYDILGASAWKEYLEDPVDIHGNDEAKLKEIVKERVTTHTSVIPFPIVAHTQAVAYALGEKAAELIGRDYGSSNVD
ncbi:hypothetical protein ONZ45_g11804 [Pleurotus djamor]|nr:hypothetical protein ONZ45_g11804 [Pleurotus djamor]